MQFLLLFQIECVSFSELNVSLTPLTASEQDKQYVSLTLVIRINSGKEGTFKTDMDAADHTLLLL